jgi:hypothetical protein
MTRTIEQMIQSEVLCCMSSLVWSLNSDYGTQRGSSAMEALTEQAFELAAPIDDWEEAAIEAGWMHDQSHISHPNACYKHDHGETFGASDWREACETDGLDPYQREVFEHWAVTDWFADKLEAAGEKVDKDFAGLCIWARTTTGQAIYADAVIERIYAETHKA